MPNQYKADFNITTHKFNQYAMNVQDKLPESVSIKDAYVRHLLRLAWDQGLSAKDAALEIARRVHKTY